MLDPQRELFLHVAAGTVTGAVGGFAFAHIAAATFPAPLYLVTQVVIVAFGARAGAEHAWRRWYGR